ncbi:iron-containing redox enzyme family protein [Acinetobacter baumannii]|uniref:iron-containing redox enzyme family protein n=1 Tax=Acinetobacter baumannii TaxID=470 RepID=UPI002447435F|nr:iron-containing redox enzyme family protein [Acinetobacter baumannii]MDH2566687.1 iron-containing redox enzyme family protein [Acinetobacter baumannii]
MKDRKLKRNIDLSISDSTVSLLNEWITTESLNKISTNELLVDLEEGLLKKDDIKLILAQHSHYASSFTKYLSFLLCRIDSEVNLTKLIGNLREEMGLEDKLNITHSEMYQKSLKFIGVNPDDYNPFQETLNLKNTMTKYCCSDDPLDGLAAICLGAEAIVPLIYKPIYKALVKEGYTKEATEFFRLHIDEDEDHALVMLDIIRNMIGSDTNKKERIISIGSELIELRNQMFNKIYSSIKENNYRYHSKKSFYSSSDFGNIPKRLISYIPEKLKHENVVKNLNEHIEDNFSKQRKHKVNVVDLPSRTISVTIGHLDIDQSTRLHRHNYETIIYIVQGSGYSIIGENKVLWKQGDAVYIPIWAPHKHVNTSDDESIYVACENAPLLQNLGEIALREEIFDNEILS